MTILRITVDPEDAAEHSVRRTEYYLNTHGMVAGQEGMMPILSEKGPWVIGWLKWLCETDD